MITEKRNLLNMGIMNIIAMVLLYIAAHFLFTGIILSSDSLPGTLLILVIGLVPALLWLSFFYFLDRKDPEPVHLVLAAFLAGILVQAVTGGFFGNILFDVSTWTGNASALPTVSVIFTQGLFPAVAIYCVLRYFFYPMKSFNERVDGLMYGAFIGIGYSLAATMESIFSARSISLYYIIFSLLVKFGVFSSLGALIGYAFGVARFNEKKKNLFFLLAVGIAAIGFSLNAFVVAQFRMNIATSSDLFSVGINVGFTLVLLAVVFFLIQKSIKGHEAENLEAHKFFVDAASMLVLVLFLASGLAFRAYIERDVPFASEGGKISFTIPAAYGFRGEKDGVYTFSRSMSNERSPLVVRIVSNDQIMLQGMTGLREKPPVIAGYDVTLKEFDRMVSLDNIQGRTFFAHVFEYSASKGNERIVISIESPVPSYSGHRDLAAKILASFKKEA